MIKIKFLHQVIGELRTVRFTLLLHADKLCQPLGNLDLLDPYGDEPIIMNFFIEEKYRGLGYGKKLLNKAEELVKQSKGAVIYLTVHPENEAIEMYLSKGYSLTGEKTDSGELFMIKEL